LRIALKTGAAAWVCCARYAGYFCEPSQVDAVFRQVMFRQVMFHQVMFRQVMVRPETCTLHSRPGLRPCPQHLHGVPCRRFETGPAGIEMGDDRPAHAPVPELGDVLGDFCGRRVLILRFEKLADPVGLPGRRETIERADVEAIVTSLQSPQFAENVRGIPGVTTPRAPAKSRTSAMSSRQCRNRTFLKSASGKATRAMRVI
jgi:hypothetical protein